MCKQVNMFCKIHISTVRNREIFKKKTKYFRLHLSDKVSYVSELRESLDRTEIYPREKI